MLADSDACEECKEYDASRDEVDTRRNEEEFQWPGKHTCVFEGAHCTACNDDWRTSVGEPSTQVNLERSEEFSEVRQCVEDDDKIRDRGNEVVSLTAAMPFFVIG